METENNNQPFNRDLAQVDEFTFQDEQGKIYTSPIIITDSAEESVPYVARELGRIVNGIVRTRKGKNWTAPTLSLAEYIDRIKAYQPVHCQNGRSDKVCLSVAEDALEEKLYHHNALGCVPNVARIGKAYHFTLIKFADELIEHQTIKAARLLLNQDELIRHLQQEFLYQVNVSATEEKRDTISDLQAELSLCLTQEDHMSQLKTEYQQRLAFYKEVANRSILGQSIVTFHTSLKWQCFMPNQLQRNCEDFIRVQVLHYPDDVDFDITLLRPFLVNEAARETSNLAAQWLVLEWIREQIKTPILQENIDHGVNLAGQPPLTARQKALLAALQGRVMTRAQDSNNTYDHFIKLSRTTDRTGFANESWRKAKSLLEDYQAVLPLLTKDQIKRAESEMIIITANRS